MFHVSDPRLGDPIPPSLAALASSSSVGNILAVVGLRPPLKGVHARPADGSPVHMQAVNRLPPRCKAVMTAENMLLKCAAG